MKKCVLVLAIASINFSVVAEETSWLDSIKNFVGLNDSSQTQTETEMKTTSVADAASNLDVTGLVGMLTSSLDVNTDQAEGGMGAILNYVKSNVSVDQFTQLASSLTGTESLISKAPEAAESSSTAGLSGILDTASEYNDTLKLINTVKKQFEALGLKPEMIAEYIQSAQSYLNSPAGEQAKEIFAQGVEKLTSA